jgi:hypothetical protein
MKKFTSNAADFMLMALFIYSGVAKLLDIQKFQTNIISSPVFVGIPQIAVSSLVFLIPAVEIATALNLFFFQTKKVGLYRTC